MDIQSGLAALLAEYQPTKPGALFPGMRGRTLILTRFTADKILKAACDRVGLEGVRGGTPYCEIPGCRAQLGISTVQ